MVVALHDKDLDRFLSLLDPEIEIVPIVGSELAGTVYRGRSGVRDWWDNYFARFGSVDISVDEVRELGDRVITASRFHNPDEDGGPQSELVVWTIVSLRGDKILSWRTYRDEAEALASIGASH